MQKRFQSTPPVRKATVLRVIFLLYFSISIHASREEGDFEEVDRNAANILISIHASREEGDLYAFRGQIKLFYFNPRLP